MTSCVTTAQKEAMQRDIDYLEQETNNLRKHLNAQSKQTIQNTRTTLTSQTEVERLESHIAENSGDVDMLKAKVQNIEENSSSKLERYRASIDMHEKEIEKLQKHIALLEAKNPNVEKKVYPSEKLQKAFQPKKLADVESVLKRDYERSWFKNVILKSSMVIQASQSSTEMKESALEFRGEAKFKLSDYSGAVIDLTHFIESYPKAKKRARALLLLGDSYVFLKKNAAAKSYYSECAQTYKNSPEGKVCLDRKEKI